MIRKFAFKNYFCFKNGTEIDFTIGKNAPNEFKNEASLTNILGIKGANGSGKTNIIKALDALFFICTRSYKIDDNELLPIDSFFGNNEPSHFYIEFIHNSREYSYELVTTDKGIISETIHRKIKKWTKLIERTDNAITYCIKEYKEIMKLRLKDKASIISILELYNFMTELDDLNNIHNFMNLFISNVSYLGFHDHKDTSYIERSKQYNEDERLFNFMKLIIKDLDPGIIDIQLGSRVDKDGEEFYFPNFIRSHEGKNYALSYHDESCGIQHLYMKLYIYGLIMFTGGLLALDELDIHLHALLLPKLIGLFDNKEININNAQLIFTAHNTEIIDKLGKYRTILVQKDDGESYAYRLDEIDSNLLRNDRAISPLYLQGKLGGTP